MPWLTCCRKVRDRGQSPASSWLAGDYAVDRVFTTPLPRVHDNAELIVAADRRIGTAEAGLLTKGNRPQGASSTGRANPRISQIPRARSANAAIRPSALFL